MSELLKYKCIACGGTLKFSSQKQKLICTYCDTTYDVEEFEAAGGVEKQPEYNEIKNEWDLDKEGLVVYACKTCGGEVIGSKDLTATKCPFCNNPVIISNKLKGYLKPDLVIPFRLNKRNAEKTLKEYINSFKFVPDEFVEDYHIKEIKGIYVPFWTYNAYIEIDVSYIGDKYNKNINTSYYDIKLDGEIKFNKVPVAGSERFNDNFMNSIEPYDLSKAVPYSSAYMPGYLAYKYDENALFYQDKAHYRMATSIDNLMKNELNEYDDIIGKKYDYKYKDYSYNYALYPVWFLVTIWKGKKYIFAMNGQTGKIVGDIPFCKRKGVLYGLKIYMILVPILMLFFSGWYNSETALFNWFYYSFFGTSLVAILSAATLIYLKWKNSTNKVHKIRTAENYIASGSLKILNRTVNIVEKNFMDYITK